MSKRHEAHALNWDGKTVSVTFTARAEDMERLAKAAHDAFHREGKWTIQLRTIDGIEVDAEFHYRA